jgi:radical SAM protein with 4Fe4S-binding SPASM domain
MNEYVKLTSLNDYWVKNLIDIFPIYEKLKKLVPSNCNLDFQKYLNNLPITQLLAAELQQCTSDQKLLDFLFARYRYETFPQNFILEDYPPLIQIELSAICNYRCVFCFQQNTDFFRKKKNAGNMSMPVFKKIIDEIAGKIPFINLASRGEPLINPNLPSFLSYCKNRFHTIKINTNGSLITEKTAVSIFENNVNIIVISIDSFDPSKYAKLRVNGQLTKIFKNLQLLNEVKKSFPNCNTIIRISGVEQTDNILEQIPERWKNLADQITTVNYFPWENIYENNANGITKPCSSLWRRLIVNFNGVVNPCDADYKNFNQIGTIETKTIRQLWQSSKLNRLRNSHLSQRQMVELCKGCNYV